MHTVSINILVQDSMVDPKSANLLHKFEPIVLNEGKSPVRASILVSSIRQLTCIGWLPYGSRFSLSFRLVYERFGLLCLLSVHLRHNFVSCKAEKLSGNLHSDKAASGTSLIPIVGYPSSNAIRGIVDRPSSLETAVDPSRICF